MSEENRYESLSLERKGAIAELKLIQPDKLNRVDKQLHTELLEVFRELSIPDPDLRAIVFSSTGKVFSAGGDFEMMKISQRDLKVRSEITRKSQQMFAALLDIPVPVVVALHGPSVGVGTSLALACDAVVTHPTCKIVDPHVAIGLVAGEGGGLFWPQSVGMARAKRHLLTGDPLTGREAFEMGLISDLVETQDEVLPAAVALANKMAALPPIAVQGTKRTLNNGILARFAEIVDLGLTYELVSMGSEDILEAIAAFKEKRAPVYTGY